MNGNGYYRGRGGLGRVFPIPEKGTRPIPKTTPILRGEIWWPQREIDNAVDQVASMMPQTELFLAPCLILPERPPSPRFHVDKLDKRPVTFGDGVWSTTDAGYFSEIDAIFASLSCTTSPSHLVAHEIWHAAEQNYLTEAELDVVAGAFALAGHVRGLTRPSDMTGASASEWAAILFVKWLDTFNLCPTASLNDELDGIFHEVAQGAVGSRPRRGTIVDIQAHYRPMVDGYWTALNAPDPPKRSR